MQPRSAVLQSGLRWLVIASGLLAIVVVARRIRKRRRRDFDFGAVSEQWMAEHRASEPANKFR